MSANDTEPNMNRWTTTIFGILLGLGCVGCGDRDAPSRPTSDAGLDGGFADASTDGGSTGPSEVGEVCSGPTDCVDGTSCIGSADGEFLCMAMCEEPYSDCADGSICTPVSDGLTNVCYLGGDLAANAPCTSNLQCAPGLLCFGTGAQFFCRDACNAATGSGCLPGEYCRPLGTGAGVCRPTLGESCDTSADCPADGLTCTTEINSGWETVYPGGYCTTPCESDDECSIGTRCATIPSSPQGICVRPCEHVSDCRFNEQYRCVAAEDCAAESDEELCAALAGDTTACLP